MTDYEGRVIEYQRSGDLKLALVTRQTKDKLQVVDERGRHDRVSVNQMVLVHDGETTSEEFGRLAGQIRARVDEIEQQIDVELLWESVREESREFSVEELAERYFGSYDSQELSALFRTLAQNGLHFRRNRLQFAPRAPQQVAEQLKAIRRREEKEALRQRALDWMRQVLWTEENVEAPDEMVGLIQRMEDFLVKKQSTEVAELLNQAGNGLAAQEAAFMILRRTGRLAADADPILVMAGIEERMPRKVMEQADRLTPFQIETGRRDFTSLEAFSIDDEETREVDDALTLEERPDGLRVGIHIADVAHFVAKDDPLDEQAYGRSVSIYLPTRTVGMFPPRLAYDLASLNQDQWRPTMSLEVDLDETGEVLHWQLSRGQIRVAHRLSYAEADQMVQSSAWDGLTSSLKRLCGMATRLTDQRLTRGAVVIRRPEVKVRVRNDEIRVKVIDTRSPSRHLISEFMILANRLAAQHAARQGVPVIFRTQDPPTGETHLRGTELGYDPIELSKALKGLKRSRLSLSPQPHAGLGLDAYTQLTSPIRRFADVVIQRQMSAHLVGQALPYERDELMQILAMAESAEREMRSIERQSTRYWLLKYLAETRADEPFEAVVVEKVGGGYLLELPDYLIRGYLPTGSTYELGEQLRVGIERTDPKRGLMRLMVAG